MTTAMQAVEKHVLVPIAEEAGSTVANLVEMTGGSTVQHGSTGV